jgi:leucyl-tRNA synthetase
MLGAYRFLNRVHELAGRVAELPREDGAASLEATPLERLAHRTIQRVTEDAERFHFHTAVAALMEFQRAIAESLEAGEERPSVLREATRTLLRLLNPLAPHLAEEWWERLGGERTLLETDWPSFDPAIAANPRVTLVVQVNGRVRGRLELERGAEESEAVERARADEKIRPWVEGKEIRRAVYVPDRLLNLVVQ